MLKVFVSWSGGKDSTLAAFKASKEFEIAAFLNLLREDGRSYHGITGNLLSLQSKAIGHPIFQKKTSWDNYEEDFKGIVKELKKLGFEGGIFGDIDLQEHRDWVERVCEELDIKPIIPLWKMTREDVLGDFIGAGFEAIVVAIDAKKLGKNWLGRKLDNEMVNDLKKEDIDICGEFGEYHTFVIDGPLFEKRIGIFEAQEVFRNDHWFYDITRFGI